MGNKNKYLLNLKSLEQKKKPKTQTSFISILHSVLWCDLPLHHYITYTMHIVSKVYCFIS